MPRILVRPEDLRALSNQWQSNSNELQSIVSRLGSTLGALDWQARQAAGVEGEWDQARSIAHSLAWQANSLARYLSTKAQAFEDADHAGTLGVRQVASMFTVARQSSQEWWEQFQSIQLFSQIPPLSSILNLGREIGNTPVLMITSLVGFSGLMSGLFAGMRFIQSTPSQWQSKLEQAATSQPVAKDILERASKSGSSGVKPTQPTLASDTPLTYQTDAAHQLQQADPSQFDAQTGCVQYAIARRPDLRVSDAALPGAADFITYYDKKGMVIRVDGTKADLREVIKPGYAVVWDRGNPELAKTPGAEYGHIAIVEQVYPDHIQVSQAGWGTEYERELTREQLSRLAFIR
jgi:uncharacterized protein YukE